MLWDRQLGIPQYIANALLRGCCIRVGILTNTQPPNILEARRVLECEKIRSEAIPTVIWEDLDSHTLMMRKKRRHEPDVIPSFDEKNRRGLDRDGFSIGH